MTQSFDKATLEKHLVATSGAFYSALSAPSWNGLVAVYNEAVRLWDTLTPHEDINRIINRKPRNFGVQNLLLKNGLSGNRFYGAMLSATSRTSRTGLLFKTTPLLSHVLWPVCVRKSTTL